MHSRRLPHRPGAARRLPRDPGSRQPGSEPDAAEGSGDGGLGPRLRTPAVHPRNPRVRLPGTAGDHAPAFRLSRDRRVGFPGIRDISASPPASSGETEVRGQGGAPGGSGAGVPVMVPGSDPDGFPGCSGSSPAPRAAIRRRKECPAPRRGAPPVCSVPGRWGNGATPGDPRDPGRRETGGRQGVAWPGRLRRGHGCARPLRGGVLRRTDSAPPGHPPARPGATSSPVGRRRPSAPGHSPSRPGATPSRVGRRRPSAPGHSPSRPGATPSRVGRRGSAGPGHSPSRPGATPSRVGRRRSSGPVPSLSRPGATPSRVGRRRSSGPVPSLSRPGATPSRVGRRRSSGPVPSAARPGATSSRVGRRRSSAPVHAPSRPHATSARSCLESRIRRSANRKDQTAAGPVDRRSALVPKQGFEP